MEFSTTPVFPATRQVPTVTIYIYIKSGLLFHWDMEGSLTAKEKNLSMCHEGKRYRKSEKRYSKEFQVIMGLDQWEQATCSPQKRSKQNPTACVTLNRPLSSCITAFCTADSLWCGTMTGWGILQGQEIPGQGDPVRAFVLTPVDEDLGPTVGIISTASPEVFSFPPSRLTWNITLCAPEVGWGHVTSSAQWVASRVICVTFSLRHLADSARPSRAPLPWSFSRMHHYFSLTSPLSPLPSLQGKPRSS